MAHSHFCDLGGHRFSCNNDLCVCVCGVPMNGEDHRRCPIELRACSQHPYVSPFVAADDDAVAIEFRDDFADMLTGAVEQADTYGAAFLWCGSGYDDYSARAEDTHFSDHCPDAPASLRERARRRLLFADCDEIHGV